MLKNKCSVWKRIRFPTYCYYFTWSDTYFIQLETLLINHRSYTVLLLGFLLSPSQQNCLGKINLFYHLVLKIMKSQEDENTIFRDTKTYSFGKYVQTFGKTCCHHLQNMPDFLPKGVAAGLSRLMLVLQGRKIYMQLIII